MSQPQIQLQPQQPSQFPRLSPIPFDQGLPLCDLTIDRPHSPSSPHAPYSRGTSPPTLALPAIPRMNRNPKQLSLLLSLTPPPSPPTSTHGLHSTPSTACPTPTLTTPETQHDSPYQTMSRTPMLALNTASLGRYSAPSTGSSSSQSATRPPLPSLVTQPAPPSYYDDIPPTPSIGQNGNSRSVKSKQRLRSDSSGNDDHSFAPYNSRFAQSRAHPSRSTSASIAHPRPLTLNIAPITEDRTSSVASTSTSSIASSSRYSQPSPQQSTFSDISSAPSRSTRTHSREPSLPLEPYADGPVELFKGVYLGSEESVFRFECYAGSSKRVRVVNIAQEIDDPFARLAGVESLASKKGKKVDVASYPAVAVDAEGGCGRSRPEVDYAHLSWGHGESGLADIPAGATLQQLIDGAGDSITGPKEGEKKWGLWETIRWMEEARREGIPVLIHCQCGVSRSATLAIAYIVALATTGILPEVFGKMNSMQCAYDYVKAKSSWIGPNVSLVFQLVEFSRNLTDLLTAHPTSIATSFPRANAVETEDDWARRRRKFDEESAAAESQQESPTEMVDTASFQAQAQSAEADYAPRRSAPLALSLQPPPSPSPWSNSVPPTPSFGFTSCSSFSSAQARSKSNTGTARSKPKLTLPLHPCTGRSPLLAALPPLSIRSSSSSTSQSTPQLTLPSSAHAARAAQGAQVVQMRGGEPATCEEWEKIADEEAKALDEAMRVRRKQREAITISTSGGC